LTKERDVAAAAGVAEGRTLADKYRIERVLGVGGMGVVVAATHLALGEQVAIKVMLPEAAQNGEAVARFLREASASARVKSEHVVRVTDVAKLPTGAPYMVMEYLEGLDLARVLRQRGHLPVAEAVDAVLQACVAIAEAHAMGIVHRDLKPSNLFLAQRSDGSRLIKVLDFGISKVTAGADPSALETKTTALMGTPLYMSPEQLRSSKSVDTRTDIWALGVILYELVAGVPPFLADSITELVLKIATEPVPPLSRARPGAPPALAEIVAMCTQKDRDARYATVAELARALQPFAPGSGPLVKRIGAARRVTGLTVGSPEATAAERSVEAATVPPVGHTVHGRRSASVVLGLLAVAALVAGLGAAASLARGRLSASPVASAAATAAPLSSLRATPAPPASSEAPAMQIAQPVTSGALARSGPEPSSELALPPSRAPSSRPPADAVGRPPNGARPLPTRVTPSASVSAAPSSACTIVTNYDGDGQPHFRKVCP
jgi:serine/threonine-protein kinase